MNICQASSQRDSYPSFFAAVFLERCHCQFFRNFLVNIRSVSIQYQVKKQPTAFILAAFSAAVPRTLHVNCVQRYCKIGEFACFATQDVIKIHLFSFWIFLACKEQAPIDGAIGALIRFSFTFVFWSVAGICLKKEKKKKKRNKTTNLLMLSFYPRCSAHPELVTI